MLLLHCGGQEWGFIAALIDECLSDSCRVCEWHSCELCVQLSSCNEGSSRASFHHTEMTSE